MANIAYIDKTGEHNGTLTPAEYYIYSYEGDGEVALKPTDFIPYFYWDDTDYESFKRAVDSKYKTTCKKAWLV